MYAKKQRIGIEWEGRERFAYYWNQTTKNNKKKMGYLWHFTWGEQQPRMLD